MKVKKILGAIVVFVLIGLKAYNSLPIYKNILDEQAQILPEQYYFQEIELYRDAKVRLSLDSHGDPVNVFFLNKQEYQELDQGLEIDLEKKLFKRNVTKIENQEKALDKGDYFFLFFPVEGINETINLNYTIDVK